MRWILEAAETEARRPRQVQTDPGHAVLQERQASGSALRRASNSSIKITLTPSLVTGLEGGLVLGAAPSAALPSLLVPLAS